MFVLVLFSGFGSVLVVTVLVITGGESLVVVVVSVVMVIVVGEMVVVTTVTTILSDMYCMVCLVPAVCCVVSGSVNVVWCDGLVVLCFVVVDCFVVFVIVGFT